MRTGVKDSLSCPHCYKIVPKNTSGESRFKLSSPGKKCTSVHHKNITCLKCGDRKAFFACLRCCRITTGYYSKLKYVCKCDELAKAAAIEHADEAVDRIWTELERHGDVSWLE